MEAEALEPIKEIDDEPAVDPAHNRPSEIDEVFEFEILIGIEAEVVVGFQRMEVIGPQVELQLCGLLPRGVEGRLHGSLVALQIALSFLVKFGVEVYVGELLLADDDG